MLAPEFPKNAAELRPDLLTRVLSERHLWKAQSILASEPTTLLHGDTHFGNSYLLPGGRVGLLDWQLLNRGRWSHDVTYLLVTALDIESRRAHERELIGHHLDRLTAALEDLETFAALAD